MARSMGHFFLDFRKFRTVVIHWPSVVGRWCWGCVFHTGVILDALDGSGTDEPRYFFRVGDTKRLSRI